MLLILFYICNQQLDIFKIFLYVVVLELEVKGKNLYFIDKNIMRCYIDEGVILNLICRMVVVSFMISVEWEGRGIVML